MARCFARHAASAPVVAECSRVRPIQMNASLNRLRDLRRKPACFGGPEYTAANLRFALTVIRQSHRARLSGRRGRTRAAVRRPASPLSLEIRINPLLRCDNCRRTGVRRGATPAKTAACGGRCFRRAPFMEAATDEGREPASQPTYSPLRSGLCPGLDACAHQAAAPWCANALVRHGPHRTTRTPRHLHRWPELPPP